MYIGENYLAIFPKRKKNEAVNVHTKMHYLDGCVDIHLTCVYFLFCFV